MNPVVSVIIPTYNRARELRRALKAVTSQTYSHWEALVVDNHSNDNTDDVISGFDDSRIVLFKIHNKGVIAASRNLGIRHARGEYIAFLDSDDWWVPEKLETSIRHLERGFDICVHDLWGVKHEKWHVFRKRMKGRPVSKPVYSDLINNHPRMPNASVVVRTEILRQIGGQSEDPELIAAEDFECWLRISRVTERFIYIPKTLGFYWMGGNSTSSPECSLVNLKRLQSLHIAPFIEEHHSDLPIWWEYSLARAMYLTGEKTTARTILRRLARRPVPWVLLLKVHFMLATI